MGNIEEIKRLFDESIRVKREISVSLATTIERVASVLADALTDGKKAIFFGNGGSAADSQHLAAEFIGRFRIERAPLAAIALTTDTSILTCIGNDYGYDEVFSRQIRALGNAGDVAFGITTSGKSPNVIKALKVARELGLVTVGLTGGSGGLVVGLVNFNLNVACSTSTANIQESHITIGHIIMELVDQNLLSRIVKGSECRQMEV